MAHQQKLEHDSWKPRTNLLKEESKTQKSDKDIFIRETTLDSKTHISEEYYGVIGTNLFKGNNSCATSKNPKENIKRKVLINNSITDPKNAHKRSEAAFCKTMDEVISTSTMQSDINYVSGKDINSPRQNELETFQLTDICSELECQSENKGGKKLNYIENKILFTSEQSSASNKIIFQTENESVKASDSDVPSKKMKVSFDNNLAIPGPSNFCENISQPNFSEMNIEDRNLLIEQIPEERKDSSMSLDCKKKEISGHIEVHEGKDLYGNCQREYTCDVCRKGFECFIELEDHYLDHEEYHLTFCRICKSKIDEHWDTDELEGEYKCCYQECTYESNRLCNFRSHLYTHFNFSLFKCERCGKRYRMKASLNLHSKTPCQMWKKG